MIDLPRNQILLGDATNRLRALPDDSVDTVVTSPPYFRLRDYQAEGQLGLEAHVADWVRQLRLVAEQVARVLVPGGTCWLNLGDTYSTHLSQGAPRKGLLLGPERLTLALMDDGWLIRNKIIWAKTNSMPTSPPIVIRDLPPQHGRVASSWLTRRSDWCLQLNATRPVADESEHMPVFFTDKDLPFGAGRDYLYELTVRLDLQQRDEPVEAVTIEHSSLWDASQITRTKCEAPDCPFRPSHSRVVPQFAHNSQAVAMLTALAASASRKPKGTPQTLLLAVPHPIGGPRHLIAVYFEAALADHLRHLVATRTGPILTFDKARLDRATPLKWCYVSDEREEVTKRRDIGRPVIAYQGKNVLIWGVGGLGSWIAEYITRAGAKKVTVCDNGIVTGGLLVRQNFADLDIGASKADRLAERLRAITNETIIESRHSIDDDELQALATSADLIIDATINRVVTRRLETLTNKPNRTAVIAQVATDARTGCLGIAMVYGPGQPAGILETDVNTGHVVEADPTLEPYQVFWKDPEPGDEFVPTRGCSLPTFHGSAADLAAVAASLTNFIAPHLTDNASGTHLFALPHSGVTPPYRYTKHQDAAIGTS